MMSEDTARQRARRSFWQEHSKSTYECPDCGRRKQQLRSGFEVHHIDGDPSNNNSQNLIALCRPCHNIREGKKPSLNELRLIQEQLTNTAFLMQSTPFVESREEASEVFRRSDAITKPCMFVKQITRRKYATLEIDFEAAKGWKTTVVREGTEQEREREIVPQLTEEATEIVNLIMGKYSDEEQADDGFSAMSTAHGASFISCPPLLPDVCLDLASELRPVVMNESNWETPSRPF